jgi:cytochrome c peroxidase
LRATLIAGVILSATLVSCDGPFEADGPDEGTGSIHDPGSALARENLLDVELRGVLIEASLTGTLDEFKLPHSAHLAAIPQDPANPLTRLKVKLGQCLYHETGLAFENVQPVGEGTYSCASCHHAHAGFQANLPQGIGEGGIGFGLYGESRTVSPEYATGTAFPDVQPIRSPSTLNCAFQELALWNGQFGAVGPNVGTESRWTPGTPLESNLLGFHGVETQAHAGLAVHRIGPFDTTTILQSPMYEALFHVAFPMDPQPVTRLNAALAIAAYERTLLASKAPFQGWLSGNVNAMTDAQKRGAIVFFGEGGCVSCHTGPALNSMTFHALGMNDLDKSCDASRVTLIPFGGTIPDKVRRGRGGFTGEDEDMYAFKTPQLYNLVDSPFYGHGASFASVAEVVHYKNAGVPENQLVPHEYMDPGFVPLGLSASELADLVAFLEEGLHDPDLDRYVPQRLPSGNCFPDADASAMLDLGCREQPKPPGVPVVAARSK